MDFFLPHGYELTQGIRYKLQRDFHAPSKIDFNKLENNNLKIHYGIAVKMKQICQLAKKTTCSQ